MNRDLLGAFVRACRSNGAHLFEVTADGVTTKVTVAGGHVASVEESGAGEPLGRVLVRKQLLTQEQYIDVLERMTEALATGEPLRFGEVAVGLGYVTEEQTRRALTEQIRGRAMRMLARRAPTWTSRELDASRDASRDVVLSFEALVFDALRLTDDDVKRDVVLADLDGRALAASWSIEEIDARFELTPEESLAARKALSGTRLVRELLDDRAEEVDAHALVAALVLTGAAVPRDRASEPLPMDAASAPRKTRAVPPPLPAWATIDAERAKDAMARTVSRGTMTAVAVADVERRLRAEQSFQRGKGLLRQGRSREALVELARAASLEPASAEFRLYARWTERAESGEALTPEDAVQLEELAAEAIAVSPSLAFGHFVRGELARARRDEEGARRHLRHALRLEPGLFASERAIRVAALRRSKPDANASANAPANADAPAPASAPANADAPAPAPADAPAPAPAPAPRRRPLVLAAVLLVLLVLGAAAAFTANRTAPAAVGPSTVVAAVPPPSVAPAPVSALPSSSAPPSPPSPSAIAAPSANPSSVPAAGGSAAAKTGVLLVPPRAVGRRVALDGKLIGDARSRMTVPCGRHTVRLGKNGTDATVDVPCGGEIAVSP